MHLSLLVDMFFVPNMVLFLVHMVHHNPDQNFVCAPTIHMAELKINNGALAMTLFLTMSVVLYRQYFVLVFYCL